MDQFIRRYLQDNFNMEDPDYYTFEGTKSLFFSKDPLKSSHSFQSCPIKVLSPLYSYCRSCLINKSLLLHFFLGKIIF